MSRRTANWGWMATWMPRSLTGQLVGDRIGQKGMSPVTTSATVWLQHQPFTSTLEVPAPDGPPPAGGRRKSEGTSTDMGGMNFGAMPWH
ncbi:hypothetical protein ABZ380_02225 [Streptomyces sp. NPDC005901]|uniref:hypothetical protein n=1 Tax=Streptomyces sp. NPDC005901 TaxID=3157171 RepID=UPI0033C6D092